MLKLPKKGDIITVSKGTWAECRGVEVINVSETQIELLFSDRSLGWHSPEWIKWEYEYQLEFDFNPRAN